MKAHFADAENDDTRGDVPQQRHAGGKQTAALEQRATSPPVPWNHGRGESDANPLRKVLMVAPMSYFLEVLVIVMCS